MAVDGLCNNFTEGCIGRARPVAANATGAFFFASGASLAVIWIVVDSNALNQSGPFDLTVTQSFIPENGFCIGPAEVELNETVTIWGGDTNTLDNDITGIDCGDARGPWSGPQAYYRIEIPATKEALIELEPASNFDPALYAFQADTACSTDQLNAACTGLASDQVGMGLKEMITIPASATDQTYKIAVDSWSPSEGGTFVLRVTLN